MRRTTKLLVIIATAASTVAFAGAGWAYWTTSGSGSGSASVGTLATPVITTPITATGSTVSLTWSAVTAPGTGSVTYYVLRDNAAASAACGSSSSPIAGTSCTDSSVPNGLHNYTVTAKFRSWTALSASASVTVNADNVPPTVSSANLVTSSPTNASSVQWTVSFSESVSGVDNADFGLANTGLTAPAVTGVSGSGSTYTVTASTGTGTGTLGLNVLNNGTIKDLANNPLSGATFNGATYTIDRTAPGAPTSLTLAAGQDSGSNASDGITNIKTPQFTGTAEANSTITLFSASTQLGSGTTNGSGTFTATISSPLADGAYTITARATDAAGNTSGASTGKAITIDTIAPTATDIQIANGGNQAGQAQKTDVITFTFSGAIDPTSIRSGWNGSAIQSFDVRIYDGGTSNDTVEIWDHSAGTKVVGFGSIGLGRTDYVSGGAGRFVVFGDGSSNKGSTTTMAGNTVQIVLEALDSGASTGTLGTATAAGTVVWTPGTTFTDLAGNAMLATSATESGAVDKDF